MIPTLKILGLLVLPAVIYVPVAVVVVDAIPAMLGTISAMCTYTYLISR